MSSASASNAPGRSEAEGPDQAELDHERLQFALSSAQMGTWDWNAGRGVIEWDDRMHEVFGIPHGTFTGKYEEFLGYLYPRDRERVAAEIDTAVKCGGDYDGEFRVIWPDGSMHYARLRFHGKVLPGSAGLHISGVCWDVTRRRQAEETLARERHLFRTLMEHLPDNIYFKNIDSEFVAVNRGMAERIGAEKPEDVVGKTDFDLFTEEHARQARADEERILRSGEPIIGVEEREIWRDGRESWVSTTKGPLRDQDGQIVGTFGLSRDITERKQAEEQLAKFSLELRTKNELLEQDLEMARELQNAMLPQHFDHFPRAGSAAESAMRFHHYYNPSSAVSGDFFDFLEVSPTVAGVFICDVMGHGVRAALVAAIVRALIGELRSVWSEPDQFMTQLNGSLRTILDNAGITMFVSACYVVVDLENGELRHANAGHPSPLRVKQGPDGRKATSLNGGKPGPALGIFDRTTYQTCRSPLGPQEIILLFTDGLFEVEGEAGELYDYRQLRRAVTARSALPTRDLCSGLVEEVRKFSGCNEFSDDVCLIAVEVDHLVGRSAAALTSSHSATE